MTFTEAKALLADLADGEYHDIKYQETIPSPGEIRCSCGVYIHKYRWHCATTWEAALKSLADEINHVKEPTFVAGQAPTEDVTEEEYCECSKSKNDGNDCPECGKKTYPF